VNHPLFYHKIKLIQDIPTDLPPIHADHIYLEEILFNLIVNATQALKGAEKGRITISAEKVDQAVVVKIADNGSGMTSEQQQNIFKPFYTTKEEGTGLGLYITKQLVEKNGGKITVTSKPGQGTTFMLTFQRASG